MEYSGCPYTEKVRHPAEMSSPPFPLAFVSMAGFSIQRVHILFHRALPPCQEKCLVVNKHQTRARKCWLLRERCQLHWLLWQVTIMLLVASKNDALPNCLLYCLNWSIFTMITGRHCVTHVENVSWYYSQATSLQWIVKCQQQMGVSLKKYFFFFFSTDSFLQQLLPRWWFGDTAESSCKRSNICKRDLNPLTAAVDHKAKHAGFCWFCASECLIQYLWF